MRSKVRSTVVAVVLSGLVAVGCSDDDGGDGGTGDSGASGDAEAADGSFCDVAQAVSDGIATAGGPGDVAEIVEQMRSLDVPDEISDDWDAIADVFGAVTESEGQPPEEVPSVDVDQQRAMEASEAVNAYVEEECDFSFGG